MLPNSQLSLLDKAMPSPAHWAMFCTQDNVTPWQPYAWTRLLNRELVELAQARAEYLEYGSTEKNRFLIVEAPVRHGKSQLGSIYFPSWWLGMFHDDRIIQTGHTGELASTFSVASRDALKQHGEEAFGVTIRGGSSAKDRWDLSYPNRGGSIAVGVGAPPTGRGGHLIIIDDPIKSSEEARSKTYQERLQNWWQFDIRNRLEPGGVVLIIMSRWAINDLVGWLKKRQADYLAKPENNADDVDTFRVLHLPALADSEDDALGREFGEPLCPERYNKTELLNLRNGPNGVGPIAFEALFQNNPRPAEGALFKTDKIGVLDAIPMDGSIRWVRIFDLAATEKETNKGDPDWTAGVLMGRTPQGHTIIADVRRMRKGAEEVERFVRATAEEDWARFSKPIPVMMPQDPGQAGKAQTGHYSRNVLYGMVFDTFPESGDKVTRAGPFAGQVNAGNVYMVRGPWNPDYIEELQAFPNGSHDDMVDASNNCFSFLADLMKKRVRLLG